MTVSPPRLSNVNSTVAIARDALTFQAEFREGQPRSEVPVYLDANAEALVRRELIAMAARMRELGCCE